MTTINQSILDTILGHLALLFLTAAGDPAAARQAAAQALTAYNVQTDEELRLASEIISFSFHALQALSQAGEPDLSLNRTLRLRGSAVSLSREAHKSQRKLDQLQRSRHAPAQQQPAEIQPNPPAPRAEPAPDHADLDPALTLANAEHLAKHILGKDNGKSWSQSFQKRQTARRMTENLKKNQARHAAQAAYLSATASPVQGAGVSI